MSYWRLELVMTMCLPCRVANLNLQYTRTAATNLVVGKSSGWKESEAKVRKLWSNGGNGMIYKDVWVCVWHHRFCKAPAAGHIRLWHYQRNLPMGIRLGIRATNREGVSTTVQRESQSEWSSHVHMWSYPAEDESSETKWTCCLQLCRRMRLFSAIQREQQLPSIISVLYVPVWSYSLPSLQVIIGCFTTSWPRLRFCRRISGFKPHITGRTHMHNLHM